MIIVEDATLDPRFANNPLVTDEPNIGFYAGATLTTREGHNLGTLCIIDTVPRARLTEVEQDRLRVLADIVVDEIEFLAVKRQAALQDRLLQLSEIMSGVGRWRFDFAANRAEWSGRHQLDSLRVGIEVFRLR